MSYAGETIWIIGASSGIGEALAHELANQGATLILSARNEGKLKKIKEQIGEKHWALPLDVSDVTQVRHATQTALSKAKLLDRVIFLAGIYDPKSIEDINLDYAQKIMNVNFMGALYITQAIMPIFKKQGAGQLVLCASVAGKIGLPKGQPYSASKAALINFTESLHAEAPDNINIKLINPGFVTTPLTDKNDFDMPMVITPDQAATAIAKGLQNGAFEIHFPKKFTYLVKVAANLPYFLKLPLSKRLGKKAKKDQVKTRTEEKSG